MVFRVSSGEPLNLAPAVVHYPVVTKESGNEDDHSDTSATVPVDEEADDSSLSSQSSGSSAGGFLEHQKKQDTILSRVRVMDTNEFKTKKKKKKKQDTILSNVVVMDTNEFKRKDEQQQVPSLPQGNIDDNHPLHKDKLSLVVFKEEKGANQQEQNDHLFAAATATWMSMLSSPKLHVPFWAAHGDSSKNQNPIGQRLLTWSSFLHAPRISDKEINNDTSFTQEKDGNGNDGSSLVANCFTEEAVLGFWDDMHSTDDSFRKSTSGTNSGKGIGSKNEEEEKPQGDNKCEQSIEQKNAIVEANPIVEAVANFFNVLWSTDDVHDYDGEEVEKKKNPIVDKTPNAEAKNPIAEALDSSTQQQVGSMNTTEEQTNHKEVPRKAKHRKFLIAKMLKNFNFKKANNKKSKCARPSESEQSVISDITAYTRDNGDNEVPWDEDTQEQIHPVVQLLNKFCNELYSTIVDDVHYGGDNDNLVNSENKTCTTNSASETTMDSNIKEIFSTKKQDDEVVKSERTGEKSRRLFARRFFARRFFDKKKDQRSDSEPSSLLGKRKAENGNTDDKQMKKKVKKMTNKKVQFPFKRASKSIGSTLSKNIQFPFQRTSKKVNWDDQDSNKPKWFNEALIGGFYRDRSGTSRIYRGGSELAAAARSYEGDMARCDQRNGTGTKWIPTDEEDMKLHWHWHHKDPL